MDRPATRTSPTWAARTGDDPQRRRLAAAAGAQEGEELARRHDEVDVVDRGDVAEALDDVAQLDVGGGRARAGGGHRRD
jgi:hypothetical protein